jgi:hypothetical protein
MMGKTDERYLQFPLSFLGTAFSDIKGTMSTIIAVGLYRRSQATGYTKEQVAKQILYHLYRNRSELSQSIKDEIEALNSDVIGCDEDYNGFIGDVFDPEDEISDLTAVFGENEGFYDQCIEHYQMHEAKRFMKLQGDTAALIEEGKRLIKEAIKGEPWPNINLRHLFEFRDQKKSEDDIAQLCAYIAIRSILGIKSYTPTNIELIVCRMFGYSSVEKLPGYSLIKDKKDRERIRLIPEQYPAHQRDLLVKYIKPHHRRKLMAKLIDGWGVIMYSKHTHCTYISAAKRITLEDMIYEAKKIKLKNKMRRQQLKTNEAEKKADERLKKELGK